MNPETNRFECLRPAGQDEDGDLAHVTTTDPYPVSVGVLHQIVQQQTSLLRPNGEPVPQHWTQFRVGEVVAIKNYSFRVAYIGETAILFEPLGPVVLGG